MSTDPSNTNSYHTEEVASSKGCPVLRTGCQGSVCMMWRWEQLMTSHPKWKEAMVKAAIETGEKNPPFAKAAKLVNENRERFNLVSDKGYCSIGAIPVN